MPKINLIKINTYITLFSYFKYIKAKDCFFYNIGSFNNIGRDFLSNRRRNL